MLSNAFSKSTKFSLPFCALLDDVSESEDLIDIFSFLDPAFSSLNLLSTTLLSLSMTILARILLGMKSRVILHQLLQSFNARFFGIVIMVASFQSCGIHFVLSNFGHEGGGESLR